MRHDRPATLPSAINVDVHHFLELLRRLAADSSLVLQFERELAPQLTGFSDDARAIVSEPLDDLREAWVAVPESSFLTVSRGEVTLRDFAPASA